MGWERFLQMLAWVAACNRISLFGEMLLTQLQCSEGLQQSHLALMWYPKTACFVVFL